MKIWFKNMKVEEKEEKFKEVLLNIDPTRGFIDLYEMFCEQNKDIVINRKEFNEFIENRKR